MANGMLNMYKNYLNEILVRNNIKNWTILIAFEQGNKDPKVSP